MSTDPLMENYPNVNPYVYCVQNPINFTDPTGMSVDDNDYGIDKDGKVTLLKVTNDAFDRLYTIDEAGNKVDNNKDGNVDTNDAVKVSTGVLEGLRFLREGSMERRGREYYSSISEYSKKGEKDYTKLFEYIADFADVEFSLDFFKHKGKNYIELSTYHDTTVAPGPHEGTYFMIHNHPYTNCMSEFGSMGESQPGRVYRPSDLSNAIENEIKYPFRVYFPHNKKMYNVDAYGIKFVGKVNSANDFRK